MQYVLSGIEAVDKAIAIKRDYMEAIAYKNLLLRLQANLEKDPARQQALLRKPTPCATRPTDCASRRPPARASSLPPQRSDERACPEQGRPFVS